MKITSVDVWTVVVPTIPGRVHSPELVEKTGWDEVPKHMVRLNTDTEMYGIGESGRGVEIDEIREAARKLIGRDPERLTLQNILEEPADGSEEMLEILRSRAYHAFEIAVFDLVGRTRGIPAHALIGGAVRDRVKADYWVGHQTPEDGKRSVERALKLGFKGVKIKCKYGEYMAERLEAFKEAGGVDFKVTVDPNERFYTAEQAIEVAELLKPIGNVEVFEDPIPKTDLEGYIQIKEAIDLPVAMHLGNGEGVIRAVKAEVVDCVNLGGGLVGFMKNAAVAEASGLRCWHGSGNDLGLMDTAAVHAASVAPNCTMASDIVGSWTREDDLIQEEITFADGYTPVPMKPGIGCELDMAAVEKYTTTHEEVR